MAKYDFFMNVDGVNDLDFSENIDFSWTSTIQDSLVQRLQLKFKTYLGTWGYNTSFGVDYIGIMQAGFSKEELDNEFVKIIMEEEDVTSVKNIISRYDNKTRRYEIVSADVLTDGGLLTLPLSNPYEKTNEYPTPYNFDDFVSCLKTEEDIEDINRLYDFVNYSGLPLSGDSYWWADWKS